MTLLQLVLAVTWFVFVLFAIDLYQRRKFNLLHFLVFFWWTASIVLFVLRPDLLNKFGNFFGLARGADVIVYVSIICLAYFYFELLNKDTKHNGHLTKLVSELTIQQANKQPEILKKLFSPANDPKENYVFLIRAYNEERTIWVVLDTIIAAGFSRIVIVNDGSRDDTTLIVEQKQTEYSDKAILLLSHPINRGPGAANKTLFGFVKTYAKQISSERCVTFDADDQMNIADMETFMSKAETGKYDVLLGSRFAEGGRVHNIPRTRRVILRGARLVSARFTGIRVTDPPNGYKVIRKDVLKDITIDSDGMNYSTDLLASLKALNVRHTEVGVHIVYTEYSLSKGQKNSNAFKILWEMIYKTLFFK